MHKQRRGKIPLIARSHGRLLVNLKFSVPLCTIQVICDRQQLSFVIRHHSLTVFFPTPNNVDFWFLKLTKFALHGHAAGCLSRFPAQTQTSIVLSPEKNHPAIRTSIASQFSHISLHTSICYYCTSFKIHLPA